MFVANVVQVSALKFVVGAFPPSATDNAKLNCSEQAKNGIIIPEFLTNFKAFWVSILYVEYRVTYIARSGPEI